MSDIERALRTELLDPEYSEGYAEAFLNAFVATQIKVIREQRQLTQAQLASLIGTTQTGISRIENVNYSSWSIRTLIKLARAFEVRLKVSFEPFGTLPDEVVKFTREFLERVRREEDPGLRTSSAEEVEVIEELLGRLLPPKKDVVSIDSHPSFLQGEPSMPAQDAVRWSGL